MMGPQFEGGPSGGDRVDADGTYTGGPSQGDNRYHQEREMEMGAPDQQYYGGNGTYPPDNRYADSPSLSQPSRDREGETRKSGERNRSRNRPARTASGQIRLCKKCGEPLMGQFVRALGGTYHLDCFRCRDCGDIVASKFFPVDEEDGSGNQYPLCETDYFRRLDLLCHKCGGALRGSYITALDCKYHIDHFTCTLCPTIFGAQDSYYEHDGKVYCHYHYSTRFAQRCNGCQTAILKQFVEIFRNGQNQHWHPECYMIHKFWNVRLASSSDVQEPRPNSTDGDSADEAERNAVRDEEERMEDKVYRIWSVLSSFEESSAACISDMLLHVSNGAYVDGVLVAKKFIWHVDILFGSADRLEATWTKHGMTGFSYGREAKLLCKKIVAFFSLLSRTQEKGVRKLGVTQELLSLVTGLAHYLKLLIRICLQGALKIEKEQQNTEGLNQLLSDLNDLDELKNDKSLEATAGMTGLAEADSDQCAVCRRPIEDECARSGEKRCHMTCLCCSSCSRELQHNLEDVRWSEKDHKLYCNNCGNRAPDAIGNFQRVTKLQQYVFLLRVALARLLSVLRTSGMLPHTSDDPNLNGYDSTEGHRPTDDSLDVRPTTDRSKSYGGEVDDSNRESTYENTLNDVRRLRSTRMERHLSSTARKSRTSRILDGPEGRSVRPGSAGADGSDVRQGDFSIVEEDGMHAHNRDLIFGHPDALTLDDIPRIVAAEQAKEQRPNAYKHAHHDIFRRSGPEAKLLNGHQRNLSSGNELDQVASGEPSPRRLPAGKKYFSELTALDYFIVRHVAVLSMQPLLDGQFTLEELLSLIESRKPTFWNKFGKAFKNDGRKGAKKKGVFGVPLDVLLEREGADSSEGVGPGVLKIPALVDDAVTTMRKMDLSVEGVFRKNGNIGRLKEMVAVIDRDGTDAVDLSKENVVQVAALLKKFLRELPDPLLTYKLHRLFITTQKITDDDKRRRVLHLTCCLLPKAHRDCLEVLTSFLKWVASFHQVDEESGSKMDVHNLATVIAPNILFSNAKIPGMDDSFLAIEAVESLIQYSEDMCEVPEDLLSILNDSSLFSNPSDITTKEILKRYGDIATNGGPKHQVETTDPTAQRGGNPAGAGRPVAPVLTRVDTDPSQVNAWQKESSVRPVNEPAVPTMPNAVYHSPQTQQQQWQDQGDYQRQMPQRPRPQEGPSDNGGGNWRNSGWGRQQNGSVGVTGAT